MLVSVLIGTRNRPMLLERCVRSVLSQDYTNLEIIVLDDGSDDPDLCNGVKTSFGDPRIRCLRSDRSLGVAAGRNVLMEEAQGDVLCILDDDAYFVEHSALSALVDTFIRQPEVAIVAGKIIDHVGEGQRMLVPFSQWTRRRVTGIEDRSRFAAYFLGGCHGIRKAALSEVGVYSDGLVFGEEEMDLSYRIISAGYAIYYDPNVRVHHHSQPRADHFADNDGQGEIYHQVRNRMFLAYKYLPWLYMPYYLIHWLSRALFTALRRGRFAEFRQGFKSGRRWLSEIEREPLHPQAIAYLKDNHGRLWY